MDTSDADLAIIHLIEHITSLRRDVIESKQDPDVLDMEIKRATNNLVFAVNALIELNSRWR